VIHIGVDISFSSYTHEHTFWRTT